MKFHYVYEITNNINSKKYIGKRSCSCNIEQDQYMGSGKVLKTAFSKYGIENFSKEILFICDTEEDAFQKEKEQIDKVNATENPMYYNIADGGHGGYVTKGYTSEQKKIMTNKISTSLKGHKYNLGIKFSEEHRKNISKSHADVSGDKNPRSVQAIVVIDNQTYIKNTRDEMITFIYENFGIKASKWFSRGVPNKYKHRVSLVKTIDKNKNEKIYYKSLQ